ncbi:intestinal mucin-like protein [Danio aesculapii]|uniref:intestinal mucin-like protein n=1 Tax=Danio aesculapii TaxID=1142201 RepID=UPI0024BF2729|nr:intestinal mucin-like protein [Danio aesculapii]
MTPSTATEIKSPGSTTSGTTPTSTITTTSITTTPPTPLTTTTKITSTITSSTTTPTSTATPNTTTTMTPSTATKVKSTTSKTPHRTPALPVVTTPPSCYDCTIIHGSATPVRRNCLPPQNITCQNHQPSVLFEDDHNCCPYYVCDCFCQGWGDSHYITFDGLYYTYQGNCTYILMKEISPQFNLTIYIEKVYCDPAENVSCPRSLIVSYNEQNITLRNQRLIGGANLEALEGNDMLTLPYVNNGVRVISSDLNLLLEIPKLNAYVLFGVSGFSINLPFQYFGKNTEGQCGTCNNNQTDDCPGSLANDCKAMAENWNNTVCTPPALLPTATPTSTLTGAPTAMPSAAPTATPTAGPSATSTATPTAAPTHTAGPSATSTAMPTAAPTATHTAGPSATPKSPHPDCYLLNTTFEACHSHVPPENFFLACQYDSSNNPAGVCATLQSYASVCAMFGVCIYWRNYTSQCNIGCSEDKVFLPCGSFDPPTCRDKQMESNITVSTEGCFCSQNTTLFTKDSGVCVPQPCGCLDQSGKPIEFNENYTHNCEDCVCDKARMSVICKPMKCPNVPPVNCTEPFMLVNVTDPSEPCCRRQVCKPKELCAFNNTECKPGTKIHVEPCVECNCAWDPWTELYQMNCYPEMCPDDECLEGFEYVKQDGECCGTCKLISCIYYREDNTKHILYDGDVKNFTCETVSCHEINGSFLIEKSKTVCPYSSTHVCEYGFKYVTKDGGCCGTCEPVACIYHSPDNTIHILKDEEKFEYECQTVTCNQVNGSFELNITSTECIQSSEACVSGFQYVKKDGECCGSCVQVACIYDAPDKTTHVLQEGLRYNFTCMNVTCLKRNDVFTIKESYKKCPSFNQDNCVEGTKRFDEDGCCPICETRNCAPVKNVTRLKVNNCSSTEDVEITSCAGHCDSKSMYSMWTNRNMTNSCSCCQAEKTSIREVTLMCEGDLQISQIYTYIETCTCTPVMCEDYNNLRQGDYD